MLDIQYITWMRKLTAFSYLEPAILLGQKDRGLRNYGKLKNGGGEGAKDLLQELVPCGITMIYGITMISQFF